MNQQAEFAEAQKTAPPPPDPVKLYWREFYADKRQNFAAFRRYMRPRMLWDWWLEDAANHLQQFYEDMIAGKRPKLCLQAPPQHGKSWTVEDFCTWVVGRNPDLKLIFASYADSLGERINNGMQRSIKHPHFAKIFPHTQIDLPGWICRNDMFEFVGRRGSFRNVTVQGPINGHELNLGVIDDPIKGRAEANSDAIRLRTWNWFADDFFARFANNAGMLIICTRWHVDDLVGRFLERFPGSIKELRYKAVAESDEYSDDGELRRCRGDALFPALKPLDFLDERRAVLTQAGWASEYQQSPIIVGGGTIPVDKLKIARTAVDRSEVMASVRYWDKAGTEDGGAFTAGVLMHMMKDKSFVIEHIMRGQWAALEREQRIKQLALNDRAVCRNYEVWVEQEPGSGGKESAEATIRNLAGFRAFADKVGSAEGNKTTRAEPFAAQVQNSNVKLIAGAWVPPFLDECETWPFGKYRDQVDACAGAFNKLAPATSYSTDYKAWV